MKTLLHIPLIALFASFLLSAGQTLAQATKPASNATGIWKWSFKAADGQSYERSVTLKQQADKLIGTSQWPDGSKVLVEEGQINGNVLSFSLTRENQGNKVTSKYQGTISGDSISGKIEFTRDGQTQSHDWQATRAKAPSAPERAATVGYRLLALAW